MSFLYKIDIVWEGGSGTDENVKDWWNRTDDNSLVVEYDDSTTEVYQEGRVVESRIQSKSSKAVLLVQGYEVGEVQVRGVFDSPEKAEEYADEELGRGVSYRIASSPHY